MLSRTLSLYKSAYSGLSLSTWLLSAVMLVNRSGTMVFPFITLYLAQRSMGYSLGQVGFVVGLFGLGAVCGGWLGGRITDKIIYDCLVDGTSPRAGGGSRDRPACGF